MCICILCAHSHLLSAAVQSWGAEGYHLWVLPYRQERRRQEEQQDVEMTSPPHPSLQAGILQFHFIKSALTVNPCTVRRTIPSVRTRRRSAVKRCSSFTEQPGAGVTPRWGPPLPDLWRSHADPQHLWHTPARARALKRRQLAASQPRLPPLSGTQHFTGTQALASGPGRCVHTTPSGEERVEVSALTCCFFCRFTAHTLRATGPYG